MQIIGKDIPDCLFMILDNQDLSGMISELKIHKIIPNRYSDKALDLLADSDEAIEIIKKCIDRYSIDVDLLSDGFDDAPEMIIDCLCSSFIKNRSFSVSKNVDYGLCNEINRKINKGKRCLTETIDGTDSLGLISNNLSKIFDMAEDIVSLRLPVYYTEKEVPYVRGEFSSCKEIRIVNDLINNIDLTDDELNSLHFDGGNQDILLDIPDGYAGAFSIHIELDKSVGVKDARKFMNKMNAYCDRKYKRSERTDAIEVMIDGCTIDY